MDPRYLPCLLILTSVPVFAAEIPDSPVISLPHALEIALDNNPLYLNSLDYVEMAEIDFESARAIYKTKFRSSTTTDARSGADTGSTYNLYLEKLNPGGSQYSAGLYNYHFADKHLSEFRISYTLPFFRDPLEDGNFTIEEKQISVKRKKLLARISRQELINEVVNVYYHLALANEAVRVSSLRFGIAERIHARSQIRHQGGAISDIELAKYRLRLDMAHQQKQHALFNQQRGQASFRSTLGLPQDQRFLLGPAALSHIDIQFLSRDMAELEILALENRVEVVGKRDELAIMQRKLTLASDAGMSGLDISLQYAWVGESNSFSDSLSFNDQRFGLGLKMDTDFGLGDKNRSGRMMYLQYQTEKRNFVQMQEKVRMEVQQAYFNLFRNKDLMSLANASLLIVEQEFRRAEIRHGDGLADEMELLEAQLLLEEARFQDFNARVNYLMAGQTLVMATGQYAAEERDDQK
ncbi:MAG: TolC family protein [Porticoccaceae bacterium]